MKRIISIFLCVVLLFSFQIFNVSAVEFDHYSLDEINSVVFNDNNVRATGLIYSYGLSLSKTDRTLDIYAVTQCSHEVVRSGFKNLTIQRRATSDDSWEDYYEYGNVYVDTVAANFSTTLVVERGYQYRISCKHYAKKSLFVTQTISNTSNIVTVS